MCPPLVNNVPIPGCCSDQQMSLCTFWVSIVESSSSASPQKMNVDLHTGERGSCFPSPFERFFLEKDLGSGVLLFGMSPGSHFPLKYKYIPLERQASLEP